jgi:hypothetical protein
MRGAFFKEDRDRRQFLQREWQASIGKEGMAMPQEQEKVMASVILKPRGRVSVLADIDKLSLSRLDEFRPHPDNIDRAVNLPRESGFTIEAQTQAGNSFSGPRELFESEFGVTIQRRRVRTSSQDEPLCEISFFESSRPVTMNAARAIGELTRPGFTVKAAGLNLPTCSPQELSGHECEVMLTRVEACLVGRYSRCSCRISMSVMQVAGSGGLIEVSPPRARSPPIGFYLTRPTLLSDARAGFSVRARFLGRVLWRAVSVVESSGREGK